MWDGGEESGSTAECVSFFLPAFLDGLLSSNEHDVLVGQLDPQIVAVLPHQPGDLFAQRVGLTQPPEEHQVAQQR